MKKNIFLVFIILMTLVYIPVHAKDNFYADNNISLKNDITSTSFVAGNNVEVTGINNGISFVAGNNVNIKNERDYLFAAGNTINIDNVTTKDAFVAGSFITIDNSKVRDLYAAGENVKINSEITGNAYLGGETVEINSTIKGNVKISAEKIIIGSNANIEGNLLYPKESTIKKSKSAIIAKEARYKAEKVAKKYSHTTFIIEIIKSMVSMIFIAVILMALNPKLFNKFIKVDQKISEIAKMSLIGFGILILVPIVGLILLLSTIGVGLSVVCLLIYGIMIYLSAIPTAYFFGNWILKNQIDNKYLILIISLAVLYVLRAIPFVGALITFISLIFGFGMYIKLLIDNTKKNTK